MLVMNVVKRGLQPCAFSAIYSSPQKIMHHQLWDDLSEFNRLNDQPWLLAGDFNDTRSMDERINCSDTLERRCKNLNYWIENNGLMDLSFLGPRFRWSIRTSLKIMKFTRLDRVLRNRQWSMEFTEADVKRLIQNQSDHCPLFILLNGSAPVSHLWKPFRFQAAWTTHEKFEECLHSHWDDESMPLYPLL